MTKRDETDILLKRLISTLRTSHGWLQGWKEIGDYMGVSKHTAQKWERYGLPVRRGPSTRVRGIPYEIDRWMINFDDMRKKVWEQMQRREESGPGTTIKNNWRGGKFEGQSRNPGAVAHSRFGPEVLSATLESLMRGTEGEEPVGGGQ